MDWVRRLLGNTVALDTAPLIYFVEENPSFLAQIEPFFNSLESGEFRAFTSTLTITEILVKPLQHGLTERTRTFQNLLAEYMEIIPVTAEIAEMAARLRADYGSAYPGRYSGGHCHRS